MSPGPALAGSLVATVTFGGSAELEGCKGQRGNG